MSIKSTILVIFVTATIAFLAGRFFSEPETVLQNPLVEKHEEVTRNKNYSVGSNPAPSDSTDSVVNESLKVTMSDKSKDMPSEQDSEIKHTEQQNFEGGRTELEEIIGTAWRKNPEEYFHNMTSITGWPTRAESAIYNNILYDPETGEQKFEALRVDQVLCKDELCKLSFSQNVDDIDVFEIQYSALAMELMTMSLDGSDELGDRAVVTSFRTFKKDGLVNFYITRGVTD